MDTAVLNKEAFAGEAKAEVAFGVALTDRGRAGIDPAPLQGQHLVIEVSAAPLLHLHGNSHVEAHVPAP